MATTRLTTAEDLSLMPDDGWRYELIDGVPIRMSPVTWGHGELVTEFARHLGNHAAAYRLGRVASGDTGINIARDPDTVLAPDVAFVRADRLPSPAEREHFVAVIPDLVVEVISPADSPRHIAQKVQRYLAAGARLIGLAYAKDRRVVAHAPGQAPRDYGSGVVLDGGEILPGFRLALAELFEE